MKLTAAILAVALSAGSASATSPIDSEVQALYESKQGELEPAGITSEMFAAYTLWAEGQMVIGYCRGWMSEEDVIFWRGWWDDTHLASTATGQRLLDEADELYYQGYQEALPNPPSRDFCTGLVEGWIEDMREQSMNHLPSSE